MCLSPLQDCFLRGYTLQRHFYVHHIALQASYSVGTCAAVVASIKTGARLFISWRQNTDGILIVLHPLAAGLDQPSEMKSLALKA